MNTTQRGLTREILLHIKLKKAILDNSWEIFKHKIGRFELTAKSLSGYFQKYIEKVSFINFELFKYRYSSINGFFEFV